MTLRLALVCLALTSAPALAASITVDLTNLTFPAPEPTVSTKGCDVAPVPCAARP